MTRRLMFAAILTTWLCLAVPTSAAPGLDLSLSQDPAALFLGDTVTVSVNLSGLEPGEQIGFAGTTVTFSSAIFGIPGGLAGGPIAPNPADLLLASGAGFADGSYAITGSLSPMPIVSNGTLFSFDLPVLALGTGRIQFDFADLHAVDSGSPSGTKPIPFTTGGPIDYTTVVPEPALLLPLAGVLLLLRRRTHS